MITPDHFPTPDLALRGGSDFDKVRAFADLQAEGATALLALLRVITPSNAGSQERLTAVRTAYRAAVDWRAALAQEGAIQSGNGTAGADASRFLTPITDATPNLDRIGVIARYREGATWDGRTFVGGVDTPASVTTERYGCAALARFQAEAPGEDVLVNQVTLPNGLRLAGNSLLRGSAAREAGRGMVTRMAARGVDTSRMDVGGELMYTRTASQASREECRDAAFHLMAGNEVATSTFNQASYLLYQGPEFKKGSDAVHRLLLVASSAWRLGRALVVRRDLDLACMVLGQVTALGKPLVFAV
jgi:hypothetical protein